jgi:hypothetical protein
MTFHARSESQVRARTPIALSMNRAWHGGAHSSHYHRLKPLKLEAILEMQVSGFVDDGL